MNAMNTKIYVIQAPERNTLCSRGMTVVLFKHWLFLSVALSGLESSNARCGLL
jgi:hypothetical protein